MIARKSTGVTWLLLLRRQQRLRTAVLLLLAAALMLIAGWWMRGLSQRQAAVPAKLEGARQTLDKMGGRDGLESRRASLMQIRDELTLRERALSSDVVAFSGRMEAVFQEYGLTVTAATDWQAIPELARGSGVPFRRLYQGEGPGALALWNAVHTFESWPDQGRIRALEVTPRESGGIRFAVEIAVFRRPRSTEGTGSDTETRSPGGSSG